MQTKYCVRKIESIEEVRVAVPGSKSITNRALLLAALSNKRCVLKGVLFSSDSRAFLDSLKKLGFQVEANEKDKTVILQGTGGKIPQNRAAINVQSAGTAARFLTVMLALAGGEYEMQASEQMCKRPMQPLLDVLEKSGVIFKWLGEEGHFPFLMSAHSIDLKETVIDTGVSSQFASALLMSGTLLKHGLTVRLVGDRSEGSYIKMTLAMMEQFGIPFERKENEYRIFHSRDFGREEYQVEPDVSGACYFYAMAPLLRTCVQVKNVHLDSLQGDIQFVEALGEMGCEISEEKDGVVVSGRQLKEYPGLTISMKDFSDQTMTMAAIAPFASTPTLIRNVGHIRFQESDRIHAIVTELRRMGISCEEVSEVEGIQIFPGEVSEAEIETYEDHRMAMAFTLPGLKTGKITILNPECSRKTFENYFEIIEQLYNK